MRIFKCRMWFSLLVVNRQKCGLSEVITIQISLQNAWSAHIANTTSTSSGTRGNFSVFEWIDDSVCFIIIEEAFPSGNSFTNWYLIQFVRTGEFILGHPVHCSHEAVFRGSVRVIELQFGQVHRCNAGWSNLERGSNAGPNSKGAQMWPWNEALLKRHTHTSPDFSTNMSHWLPSAPYTPRRWEARTQATSHCVCNVSILKSVVGSLKQIPPMEQIAQ